MMKTFWRTLCFCLLQAACAAPRLWADCQLQLEIDHIDWRGGTQGGYDVFDTGEYAQTVYFKLRALGEPCSFFIGIGTGAPGQDRRKAGFGGEELEYWIYDSMDRRFVVKDVPAAGPNEVIQGAFAPGETVKELSFVIVVPPHQVTGAGRYADLLRITAYEGTPQEFVEKDSKTVTFSIRVDAVAELSLVPPGAPFDPRSKGRQLDFDRLAKGRSKAFDLRVRSNSGYHVSLESENLGVMRNIDPGVESTIPYTVTLGGASVNMRGGRQTALSRSSRRTGSQGDRHELQISIGETTGAVAGTYRDNISVTVISDE